MSRFRDAWHQETLELDASVDALDGFRALHDRLVTDDLPRFEAEFKNSLNENTIREVAMFQAMLNKQRDEIKDRIRTINGSLVGIDYNRDTYIELEPRETPNQEIRDFRRDLARYGAVRPARAAAADRHAAAEDQGHRTVRIRRWLRGQRVRQILAAAQHDHLRVSRTPAPVRNRSRPRAVSDGARWTSPG